MSAFLFHHIFSRRALRTRAFILAVFILPAQALAQRADDNATTSAEDAFGSSIGNESVGLYNPYEARGFSPVDAGNVRIEGLYFDQQDDLSNRIVENSRVRVGLTTLGFLFPAPTGVVDYTLRKAGDKRVVSVVAGTGQYNGPYIEIDSQFPIIAGKLGLAAGVARRHEEYFDGADGDFAAYGGTLRWLPRDGVEILPFFGRFEFWNEESAPVIITAGDYLPPTFSRRNFYSQEWADNKGYSQNHGIVAKAQLGHWLLQSGLFQSRLISERGFSELLVGATPTGQGNRLIVARQDERFASTSGELRLSYDFVENKRKHIIHVALRGRDTDSRSGGADVISLGPGTIAVVNPVAQPKFNFGPHDQDSVSQKTLGIGYQGNWAGVGELSAGVQRTDYQKINEQQRPFFLRSVRQDKPWLWNASGAFYVSNSIALYAGVTRGLEESGSAPADATNRFAVQPAIRTRQVEAGGRIAFTDDIKLVAGLFDVRKPYYALDSTRFYRELGEVQHRGVEFSLTGKLTEDFTAVIGAVFMKPRVTGEPVERGEIGRKAFAQTGRTIRANFDYRIPFLNNLSLDAVVQSFGTRIGSVNNRVVIPARTVIDVGARYSFEVAENPTTLRFRIANVTNNFGYRPIGDHAFQSNNQRHVTLFLATDL